MYSSIQVYLANAMLNDPVALEKLLAALRDSEGAARALSTGNQLYAFVFSQDDRTGRYLISDGKMASIFSLVGVTQEEADAVNRACKDKTDWSLKSFQTTVATVLGGTVGRVN